MSYYQVLASFMYLYLASKQWWSLCCCVRRCRR